MYESDTGRRRSGVRRSGTSASRSDARGVTGPGRRASEPALLDPEAIEQPLVAAPVATDPDRELEVDVAAELPFDRAPGGDANRLDHAATGSDQDSLLRFGL